jgi:hypothetical protein
MSKFRQYAIGGLIFAGIYGIGALMNSSPVAAQAPGPLDGLAVRIVNPLPVPVAGSTTVTGNVNASQSGTWNVGITGTPTVQDRDSQARNFYQNVVSNSCTGTPCVVAFPAVPAGKRLIVQQVSAVVAFNSAGAGAPVQIELRGANVFQFLPITPAPANFPGETQYLAHAGVLAAYDSGQNPDVDVFVPNNSSYTALASISGYMIDIP